jgi:ankyrin repeat protein
MWKAAQNGQDELVHYLLSRGASVNLQNKVGDTILFDCVRKQRHSLLGHLINYGADLNIKDIEENTVLHCASFLGNTAAICLLLIPNTLNVNEQNEYGNTALHNSTMHNYLDTSLCLLNHGADINMLNKNGQSCLYLTMLHRRETCTSLLHDCGARLTQREMNMFRDFESRKHGQSEKFYRKAIRFFNAPKSLSRLCVVCIRNNMKYPIDCYKTQLSLPKTLQNFVAMEFYKPEPL